MGHHRQVDYDVDKRTFCSPRSPLFYKRDKGSVGDENGGNIDDPRIERTGAILFSAILLLEDEETECIEDQYGYEDLNEIQHPIFVDGYGDVHMLPQTDIKELAHPSAPPNAPPTDLFRIPRVWRGLPVV